MSNTIAHVYILGSETETIRLCLKQISPKLLEETDGRNIWTVLGNARIPYGKRSHTTLSPLLIEPVTVFIIRGKAKRVRLGNAYTACD